VLLDLEPDASAAVHRYAPPVHETIHDAQPEARILCVMNREDGEKIKSFPAAGNLTGHVSPPYVQPDLERVVRA
jgi:hypothetical protein